MRCVGLIERIWRLMVVMGEVLVEMLCVPRAAVVVLVVCLAVICVFIGSD
jgi:hypothetical protein